MKILRFKYSRQEWSVPLRELSPDMKLVLLMRLGEFITGFGDVDDSCIVEKSDTAVVAMLERVFAAATATDKS